MAAVARPAETLRSLYEAFAARDGEAMARCYTPDATFEDPVFRVSGQDVGDMWRMLTGRGEDLRISYEVVGDDRVSWTADYTFGGNPVHNVIQSTFTFAPDGRIATQIDRFSFPGGPARPWGGRASCWAGSGSSRRRCRRAWPRRSPDGSSGSARRRDVSAGPRF
jgi:hypothetical protein